MPNRPRARKRVQVYLGSVVGKLMQDLDIDHFSQSVVFRRLKSEGPSFLTKTLPKYSSFLLLCLEHGKVLPPAECEMTHFEWKGSSPRFLRGLLMDAISGCATSVYKIRQLCDYFFKLSFSFTSKEVLAAETKFVQTEVELSQLTIDYAWSTLLRKVFHFLCPKAANADVADVFSSFRPRNGPGSFSRSPEQDFYIPHEAYKRLPNSETSSHSSGQNAHAGYFKPYPAAKRQLFKAADYKIAKVLVVPKDSRAPRVISTEPLNLLRSQMSFFDWFSSLLTDESRGRVNFASQEINQQLSYEGSLTGDWATIDLKDASDRVTLKLWLGIVRYSPALRWFALHSRSTHAYLPNLRKVLPLGKLANMGSGLCFAPLACVAWLSVIAAISKIHRIGFKEASLGVYVYGDDIIVKTRYYDAAVVGLERSLLKVNVKKSFKKGSFRESCGADFYKGIEVSPVRLKLTGGKLGEIRDCRDGRLSLNTDNALLQLERHCRELVDNGLNTLSSYYYSLLCDRFGELPYVSKDSSVIGRYSISNICSYDKPVMAYIPVPVTHDLGDIACPIKGISSFLKTGVGQGSPWNRPPLRYRIRIKKTEVAPAQLLTYGLPDVPELVSLRRFYALSNVSDLALDS